MKNIKSIAGSKLGIGVAVALVVVVIAVLLTGWGHSRFNRISVCYTCHEIFVDADLYAPKGEPSTSVEDYNPIKEPDKGWFNVTVGCAECHAYPFEEYRESPHFENQRGVRPGCIGCHNPHSIREFLYWKFLYLNTGGLGESPFHAISSSLRDVPEWEALRIELAGRVRKMMLEERSAKCINCHKPESEWFRKIEQHQQMGDQTCVNCHYNMVHKEVKWAEDKK